MLTAHIDGLLASGIVGAIVFIATKRYYQMKYEKLSLIHI